VLNTFFESIGRIKADMQDQALSLRAAVSDSCSPSKKPMFKKSPLKSPLKKPKSKVNDENASPDRLVLKTSPAKKMQSPVKQ